MCQVPLPPHCPGSDCPERHCQHTAITSCRLQTFFPPTYGCGWHWDTLVASTQPSLPRAPSGLTATRKAFRPRASSECTRLQQLRFARFSGPRPTSEGTEAELNGCRSFRTLIGCGSFWLKPWHMWSHNTRITGD